MVPVVHVLLWTLVRFPTCVDARCHMLMDRGSTGYYCLAHRQNSRVYPRRTSRHHLPACWYVPTVYRLGPSPNSSSLELKELIALHSSVGEYGGDLRSDTVTIIGATLDLQEKTAIHVRSCVYLTRNCVIDREFPRR